MIELAILCDRMDNDGSGALSLTELLDGYDYDARFHSLMKRMDIERDDMRTIFRALDADASGEVDYVEFCHQLGTCKKRDQLMLSTLTRYAVMEVRALIEGEVMKARCCVVNTDIKEQSVSNSQQFVIQVDSFLFFINRITITVGYLFAYLLI